jgi:hypothetical protein
MNISAASKEFVLEMTVEEHSDVHVSVPECITKSYSVSFAYESIYSGKEMGSVENS